jgi:hypothetical protein
VEIKQLASLIAPRSRLTTEEGQDFNSHRSNVSSLCLQLVSDKLNGELENK